MNQDLSEKRKERTKRRAQQVLEIDETNPDEDNVEKVVEEPRRGRRSSAVRKLSNENEINQDDDQQQAIIEKHRDKSREVAQTIGDENPNEVIEELHIVRDKIKDKIKQGLTDQLEKVKENEAKEIKDEIKDEAATVTPSKKIEKLDLEPLQSGRYSNPSDTLRESSLQRIKQIKQQASMKSQFRLTGPSSARKEPTRFDSDTNIKEESKKPTEDTASARKRFQKIGQSVVQEIHMPNREEQFDFFASTKFVQEQDESKKTTEVATSQTETSETVLLLESADATETLYGKAVYNEHQKEKENEIKHMFLPSTRNIPFNKKFGEDNAKNPRYLEHEGIYVGQKPYMTNSNKNLFADRLLKLPDQRGLKWFDVDGELVALSDPIKYVATRPSLNPTFITELETQYRKAIYLDDFANNLDNGINLNSLNPFRYRIDLDVNQVQFSCHPLFSAEHILAYKLKNMYNNFVLSQEQNLIEILTAKLKALKEAEDHFKNELELKSNKIAADKNMFVESTSTIIKTKINDLKINVSSNDMNKLTAYRNEIKQTRQQRDNEMFFKKNLTEKILITWKELKDIRAKQKFRNTELKLIIKRKEVKKSKEEKEFDNDLREELEEVLNEKLEEFHLEMGVYEQKLKAYKLQKLRKEEARKRQEQRANSEQPTNIKLIAEMKEMELKDNKILNEEDLAEPIKPTEVDRDKELDGLKFKYNRVRKTFGEPLLFFDLIEENGTISSSSECSREEQNRRNRLLKTKVYVKIIFNGKLVFTTSESQLQNDFLVRWSQIFNIFMITFPDSILLQLFEYSDSRSNEKKIAEINLPMPDPNSTAANYNLENYDFSSPNSFYMRLKSSNQLDLLYTTGSLRAGAGWGIDEKTGNVLVPPNLKGNIVHSEAAIKQDEIKGFDAIAALGVSRMQDIEKLAKWIVKSNLDPNDPRNNDLINLINNLANAGGADFDGLKLPEHFRLHQMVSEFDFVDEEEIDKNRRFRLIQLRSQGIPEFKGLKLLPIDERYVKKDAFEAYENRKKKEQSLDEETKEEEKRDQKSASLKSKTIGKEVKNEIEEARAAGQKYIRKIREQILTQFRFIQSQKTLTDVVIEEQVPNINVLAELFYSLYIEPKRPLYPVRRERKKITGQNVNPEDVRILVNIVNAYDLPIRKEKISNDPIKTIKDPVSGKSIKIHEHIAGESLVRPFVEITFQDTVYRTTTADGPNASWNHEIHLPFNPPNNSLKPESLQTCKDNIYFNIYDEVEIDALEDERDRDHVVHKKIMRYWLGTLKIPFSTVYFKSKIEGTFKLETPPLMLGYTRDPNLSKIKSSFLEAAFNFEAPIHESSYLTLFITIEPQLLVPEIFRETYDSIENMDLLDSIVKWSLNYTKKYPQREFRPTVMNTDGKSVIITRYFKPLKPPPELIENGENSAETTVNVARFVSLIPFVNDSLVFPGLCDVWSTCTEFLEILSGDEEEHSVLLVNYFLGLGKKAWLLIGTSITDGVGAYPLLFENAEYTIWYQGEPYKVNEPHNPIRIVSAIVNDQNIWANVQQFHEPSQIRFDVSDRKCWMPFFTKANNVQLPTIQSDSLRYFQTDPKFVKDLETRIENKLKEKLQEWRPRHITKYNRYGSSALRALLANMEKTRSQPLQNQQEPEEFKQLETSFRISGFPINLPYTNLNDICEAVKSTQVHAMPTNECEFALGVQIFSYPNTIMSVWVYIAVLTRKDR